ncbi:MAG: hypothetical protein KatS3mg076_0565 [Candidatus Binatia bacterium]|nr:MAG: hypothetical protein KatS3mg076_0565 [Candidatus Binatia bacterium]
MPIRTCVGCGKKSPKSELLRFTAVEGRLVPSSGCGRGAYLHRNPECWQAFLSRKPKLRSLRRTVDRGQRQALIEELLRLSR